MSCIILSETFTYDYARASEASERSETSCIFISHELQFNAFAFHITTWKYKRLTHWQATDKRSISRKYTCQRASRESELGIFSHLQVPITPISFNVWVGTYEQYDMFLGYFVTFCAFNAYYSWHGSDGTINASQATDNIPISR